MCFDGFVAKSNFTYKHLKVCRVKPVEHHETKGLLKREKFFF